MRKRRLQIVLSLAVTAGLLGLAGYLIAFAPVTGTFDQARSLYIPRGADIKTVADSLVSSGILVKRRSFMAFSSLSGWGDQVKAGHYLIESGSSSRDILERLRRGLEEPIRVTVPAGTRKERAARALARSMAFSTEEMLSVLRDSTFAAELHSDTTQLFGYVLPETYFFYWLTSPEDVIRRIKETTDALFADHEAELENLSPKLTRDEVLRMAAIVEWETSFVPEKNRIAGVYMNRMRNGWPLQADPTVQYVVMQLEGEKRRLLFRDYDIRDDYNTYRFRGLPPGPITNPSESSILAALAPESHGYFYFVATGEGEHIFSRTLAEHNRAASEYRRLMRQRRAEAAAAESAAADTNS